MESIPVASLAGRSGVREKPGSRAMRRLHLFEIEDQSWCPAIVRDLATDYLHFVQTAVSLHRTITPLIEEALRASGTTRIVDLCSGGSGPLPAVIADLGQSGINATATL